MASLRRGEIQVGDAFASKDYPAYAGLITHRKQLNGIWHYYLDIRAPSGGWTVGWISGYGLEIGFSRVSADQVRMSLFEAASEEAA